MIDNRLILKKVFEDTRDYANGNKFLRAAIENSNERQYVVKDEDALEKTASRYKDMTNIVVSNSRTFAAVRRYPNQKVCVLNFASSTKPGGGVRYGSGAQEECLCRCSTLLLSIVDQKCQDEFYNRHLELFTTQKMDGRYNDDLIYTPDVVVFKNDVIYPTLLPEEEWYKTDVITCAAPNIRRTRISREELKVLQVKRIKKILAVAKKEEVDVLILGAFGCGVFLNPPDIVAEAMKEAISEYLYDFRTIEFAVYCPKENDTNYQTFKKVLTKDIN